MKKYYLIFVFSIQIINIVQSQVKPNFGKWNADDFKFSQYEKDTLAEAVVLYDIGQSYFTLTDDGYQVVFERNLKMKILNKSGIKWAQIEIPYYEENQKYETIEKLEGYTYNYENSVIRTTPLDTKNTYIEKLKENVKLKKFAMPDIKVGSVFEVKYRLLSPYFFHFRGWVFQREIPVIYSEYTAKMIPWYEYTYIVQGISKFDSFRKYEELGSFQHYQSMTFNFMNYEFIMKNVPAFRDESFITSPEDYIIKLDFQLSAFHSPDGYNEQIITTWPKLIESLLEHDSFGKYLKASQKRAKEILDTMQLLSKTIEERAEIIEEYVKRNYNWNGFYDMYSSKSVKEFLKTKLGNSADVNLFLAGMLREAGIIAYPVIISTRDHGKIKSDYPFSHYFNYVVVLVKIGEKEITLDATEPLSNFSEIPTRCLNDKGLIIQKDKADWLNFGSSILSAIIYTMDMNVDEISDTIPIGFHISSTGYDALNLRRRLYSDEKKLKEALDIENFNLEDSLKISNKSEINKPFEIDFKIKILTERVEDKILISPFYSMPVSVNPFTQPLRSYPVDMIYKRKRVFVSIIHIPIGYKVFSKPENLSIDNNLFNIQYTTENVDNSSLKITGTYEFKKDVYGIFNYYDLKSGFNKIINRFNDKVVLVKN
jgi:hypothetical protein